MVERFNGLRHHTIVSGDDEHGDVGDFSTASTHGRKRLVTRGVDEGDGTLVAFKLHIDLVRTNVLSNTTGFAFPNPRGTDGIQQPSLTMVDVTHHGHHRRTRILVLLIFCGLFRF